VLHVHFSVYLTTVRGDDVSVYQPREDSISAGIGTLFASLKSDQSLTVPHRRHHQGQG